MPGNIELGSLEAELYGVVPASLHLRILHRSSAWNATVWLQSGSDPDSVQVQRSRRSGRIIVRWIKHTGSSASASDEMPACNESHCDKLAERIIQSELELPTDLTKALQLQAERNASCTASLDHLEQAIQAEAEKAFFSAGGCSLLLDTGQNSAEFEFWLDIFTQSFSVSLKGIVQTAMAEATVEDNYSSRPPLASRKKDLPAVDDADGVRALLMAQQLQAELVHRYATGPWQRDGGMKPSHLLCPVAAANNNSWPRPTCALAWEAPATADTTTLYETTHPHSAKWSRRRRIVDHVASAVECRHVIGAGVLAMAGFSTDLACNSMTCSSRNAEQWCGVGSPTPVPAKGGETGVAVQEWDDLAERVGIGATLLIARLCRRIAALVCTEFDESNEDIFLAGALLTRLVSPTEAEASDYRYDIPHIDKANVASYDYSAVLWLNACGTETCRFEGGEFCFVDPGRNEVIQPDMGRCVLFPSGSAHLHQVQKVSARTRWALAVWFTLASTKGAKIPDEDALQNRLTRARNNTQHKQAANVKVTARQNTKLHDMATQLSLELLEMPGVQLEEKVMHLQQTLRSHAQ